MKGTIGGLRKLLATIGPEHDNAPVLIPGPDHSYYQAEATFSTVGMAGRRGSREFSEWHGEGNASPGERAVPGLVVR